MHDRRKKILIVVAILVALALLIGGTVWCKVCRVVAQPAWINADQRDSYFYGSVGAENTAGMPYWLWLAMPRMFPEYMPGPGGYAALGMSWEEGREMPVGFAKQRIGYIRVTGNCALCHAISHPNGADEVPTIVAVVPGHTTDIQPLMTFFRQSAQDPRFNADEFLSEINTATKLSFLDRLLYRYILIPRTRQALIDEPENALFAPALLGHSHDPKSDATFTDAHMKAVRQWMAQRTLPAKGPCGPST
jgi:hypothetical protein